MRLTYCGNVHPANDVDGWIESTTRYAVPIARQVAADGHAFGLGIWWNAAVARQLAVDPSARERVAVFLATEGLQAWTLNVFPFGDFHGESVKTAVYRPDWADPARAAYTLDAARAAASLAPEGSVVPISTLPLGYGTGDSDRMAAALVDVASELARLADTTGRTIVLALEPEPFCLLETVAETAGFLEQRVFGRADHGIEPSLRRHLGVCVDLCHLAVVGEEPLTALGSLWSRGIAVPKIQVSSCLELRDPAGHLDALLEFDEGRYLHQTFSDGGLRALDLGEVGTRRDEFRAAARLRTHFHVPVFWDAPGALGSTRAELERVLAALAGEPRLLDAPPLLEVETYTWSVLDPSWRPESDLRAGILEELEFVRGMLSGTT